ncbi:hypothetical protein IJJ46_01545 [Candidatus Saccharibacteria bacterium]|nr:hypothetical protein [Candidatus Saccharibacteria bacterium]
MRKMKIIGFAIIILGFVSIIAAVLFGNARGNSIKVIEEEAWSLGDLIEYEEDHAQQFAKIHAVGEPHLFAQKENSGSKGYYFVVDDNYNYIVYMTEATAQKLASDGELELRGVTKEFTNDLRTAAVNWMEQMNEENEINTTNFRLYFGATYLDTTVDAKALTTELNMAIRVSAVLGVCLIILGLILLYIRRPQAESHQ